MLSEVIDPRVRQGVPWSSSRTAIPLSAASSTLRLSSSTSSSSSPSRKEEETLLYTTQSRSSRPRWCAGRIFQLGSGRHVAFAFGRVPDAVRGCVFDRPWTGERWTVIGSEKGWLHGSVERERARERVGR